MTDQTLTHQVIYSVFVRCHTPEGTFHALERDLDRIRLAAPTPSATTGPSTRNTARGRTSSTWWMVSMPVA